MSENPSSNGGPPQGPIVRTISTLDLSVFPPVINQCQYCGQFGVEKLDIHYRKMHPEISTDLTARKPSKRRQGTTFASNSTPHNTNLKSEKSRLELQPLPIPKKQRASTTWRLRHSISEGEGCASETRRLPDKVRLKSSLLNLKQRTKKSANHVPHVESLTKIKIAKIGHHRIPITSPRGSKSGSVQRPISTSSVKTGRVDRTFRNCTSSKVDLSSTVKPQWFPEAHPKISLDSTAANFQNFTANSRSVEENECSKVLLKILTSKFTDQLPKYFKVPYVKLTRLNVDAMLREKFISKVSEHKFSTLEMDATSKSTAAETFQQEIGKRPKKRIIKKCPLADCDLWVCSRRGKRRKGYRKLIEHLSGHIYEARK